MSTVQRWASKSRHWRSHGRERNLKRPRKHQCYVNFWSSDLKFDVFWFMTARVFNFVHYKFVHGHRDKQTRSVMVSQGSQKPTYKSRCSGIMLVFLPIQPPENQRGQTLNLEDVFWLKSQHEAKWWIAPAQTEECFLPLALCNGLMHPTRSLRCLRILRWARRRRSGKRINEQIGIE